MAKGRADRYLRKFLLLKEACLNFFTGFFKDRLIVGLDIGTSSIKIAQFKKIKGELRLLNYDLKEIRQNGDVSCNDAEIGLALKDLFKEINIKKAKIIVSINSSDTAIKRVMAPYIPISELNKGVNLEAKNYFPFSIDQSMLSFEILRDIVEKGLRKYELIVAVSSKKTVERYLSLLAGIGIKTASFIPASYALAKFVECLFLESDKTICFLDVGQAYSELLIFSHESSLPFGKERKRLVFSRKIPVSGGDITRGMTSALISDRGRIELTLDEAEIIKRKIGIPVEPEPKIINEKIFTTEILSMIRMPLEQLVNEIERCFDYYREEVGEGGVDALVLFGGGASLSGLTKFLAERLGIAVNAGAPLGSLKAGPSLAEKKYDIAYRLDIAIGAGLSEAGGLNLFSLEIREKARHVFRRTGIEVIVVVIIFIFSAAYIGMRIALANLKKRIAVNKTEVSVLGPQFKLNKLYSLLAGQPRWEDIFREISNLIPYGIRLTEFNMQNKIIVLKGRAISGAGKKAVSNFILTLEEGVFKNVKLAAAKEAKEDKAVEFELVCCID